MKGCMKLSEITAKQFLTQDEEKLVDIQNVKIDVSLSKEERIQSYLMQIKNPYFYKCGNTVVQSVFSGTALTLEDCLNQYFEIEGG